MDLRSSTFAPLALTLTGVVGFAAPANAALSTWDGFVIREATGSLTPVSVTENGPNGVSVVIDEGNEKAGYGTNYFNGMSLGDVAGVEYDRDDLGSGEIYANIWVTNGTKYAVIAPAHGMTTTGGYTGGSDINGDNIQTLGFNIHEYISAPGGTYDAPAAGTFDWIIPGAKRVQQALLRSDNSVITIADIAHLLVGDPNSPGNPIQGGGGAPKNGTGFNLIFGDTANHHVNVGQPYVISNVDVIPEPASLALLALGGFAALGRRNRHA